MQSFLWMFKCHEGLDIVCQRGAEMFEAAGQTATSKKQDVSTLGQRDS